MVAMATTQTEDFLANGSAWRKSAPRGPRDRHLVASKRHLVHQSSPEVSEDESMQQELAELKKLLVAKNALKSSPADGVKDVAVEEERLKVELLLSRMKNECELLEQGNRELEAAASALEKPKQPAASRESTPRQSSARGTASRRTGESGPSSSSESSSRNSESGQQQYRPRSRAPREDDDPYSSDRSRHSDASDTPSCRRRHSTFSVRSMMIQHHERDIAENYKVNPKEMSSGSYGKVYVAEDRNAPDRKVAIKTVIGSDGRRLEAFKREIEIMKELDHPNICKLLETYDEGRKIHLVMELLDGGELFDRIANDVHLSEEESVAIVRQVGAALKYAHSRGIAHRDMKPENVVFCSKDKKNSHVKVIDWGLGWYFDRNHMHNTVGTLTYAAPEVIEAKTKGDYTALCDVWSLGVVAYVMLSGKVPFTGSRMRMLTQMKHARIPFNGPPWDRVSPQAMSFLQHTMEYDPTKRLSVEDVMRHEWIRPVRTSATVSSNTRQVLQNMEMFSRTSQLLTVCMGALARQLDHNSLQEIQQTFSELDQDGDGAITFPEMRAGFERVFGTEALDFESLEEIFNSLDLDGSGKIDYTEFCAAGIGSWMGSNDEALWAAFKTFDLDGDGKISSDELREVMMGSDPNQQISPELCDEAMSELMEKYDADQDGLVTYDEWRRFMRDKMCQFQTQNDWAEQANENVREDLLEQLAIAQQDGNTSRIGVIIQEINSLEQSSMSPSSSEDGAPRGNPDGVWEMARRPSNVPRVRLSLLQQQGLESTKSRFNGAGKPQPVTPPTVAKNGGVWYSRSCCESPGVRGQDDEESCSIL